MANSATFPSLFGRATVFNEEHSRLRDTLDRLQSYCILLGHANVPPELDPQHLLEQLRGLVFDHFAGEEADDYFGTFRAQAPALAEQVGRLEAEHWRILEVIGDLSRIAQCADDRDELIEGLARLMVRLDAHERAEAELTRSFFETEAPGSSRVAAL